MMKLTSKILSDKVCDCGTVSRHPGMTFDELLREVRKIECEESREQTDYYCEVVVAAAHLEAMIDLLQSYFGSPFKPKGRKPSAVEMSHAEPYGGIHDGQTLYYQKNGESYELALLWPWGSGLSTTVKIVRG